MLHSPKKKVGFLSSPITLVFVAILTIYVLFQLFDVYSKKQYTGKLLEESEVYNKNIAKSLKDIEERNALIEDQRGRDAYLRERDGMLLEGEEVYVIVDNKTENSQDTTTNKSWIHKLLPFFN